MPIARCQGEGNHGHPVVFLNLQPSGRVVCPYCSQVFESPQHYQEGV
ncbi:zinc-finger domain-containing protein [bacterium NHP-B]|nr:zinc-finger domain-containing protein [bacterium NHP-B]